MTPQAMGSSLSGGMTMLEVLLFAGALYIASIPVVRARVARESREREAARRVSETRSWRSECRRMDDEELVMQARMWGRESSFGRIAASELAKRRKTRQ